MSDINLTIQNTTPANLTISTGLGEQGPQGPQGAAGANAPVNVVSIGTVTTGAAGSSAAATMTGTAPNQTLNLTLPRGSVGETGATGPAGPVNTLAVGSVSTGNPGDNAVATITGTAPNQTLNLTLPRGATGPTGSTGATGPAGPANTLSIGTVSTGAAGSSATATITGTAPSQSLNLTIPTGAVGPQGPMGALSDGSVTPSKLSTGGPTWDASANVGIGTMSSPTYRLNLYHPTADCVASVQGLVASLGGSGRASVQIDVNGAGGFAIQNDATSGTRLLRVISNNGYGIGSLDCVAVTREGNVGIGTSSPSFRLQLATDSAAKPSTNTWTIASDARIKENVRAYTKGLDAIAAINPVIYDYNGTAGFEKIKDNIGVIAQQIQEIVPEGVSSFMAKLNESDEQETELYNFNSHSLTYILINAVKELKAIVESQAAEIAAAKQELRDVTKIPLPDTLPEIKATWPVCLDS